MPQTPKWPDLKVADEERHVVGCLPGTKVLTGADATHDSVRTALPRFPWVHFACHAVGVPRDSAGARLLLYDHEERPLTVGEIAALRLPRAELAYLSACESAYGPAGLADEAVHLTGTFHLAGYEHVIGTLWPAVDHVAAEIAVAVYERITTPVPDAAKAALALHDAVRRARDRNRDLPLLWAAHIHVGR
jgi:CHAT domain-containing protein